MYKFVTISLERKLVEIQKEEDGGYFVTASKKIFRIFLIKTFGIYSHTAFLLCF